MHVPTLPNTSLDTHIIFFQREPLKLCIQHHPVQEIVNCKASGRNECEKFPTPSMLPHNKNHPIFLQGLKCKGGQNQKFLLHLRRRRHHRCYSWIKTPVLAPQKKRVPSSKFLPSFLTKIISASQYCASLPEKNFPTTFSNISSFLIS